VTALRQRTAPSVVGRPTSAAESKAPIVLVLADDPLAAARIEAMLRGDGRWQAAVGRVTDPAASLGRGPASAVLLALPPQRAAPLLATLSALPTLALTPFILLTSDVQGAWSSRVLRRGLRGILAAEATVGEVTAALTAARAGLLVLHPDATSASPSTPRATSSRRDAALTAREVEVLELMAEGIDNRRIAARLGISRHTVKFHVASILDKLHAASRTEAVTVGIRKGCISV
jgi:two-component system, NarL family, response regulator YdfI